MRQILGEKQAQRLIFNLNEKFNDENLIFLYVLVKGYNIKDEMYLDNKFQEGGRTIAENYS